MPKHFPVIVTLRPRTALKLLTCLMTGWHEAAVATLVALPGTETGPGDTATPTGELAL